MHSIPEIDIISKVSIHACERYLQRIVGIECEEGSLSRDQTILISKAILKILLKHHPEAFSLGNGVFKCKDDDLACILQDKTIVTIKETTINNADYEEIKKMSPVLTEVKKMTDKRHSKFKKGRL